MTTADAQDAFDVLVAEDVEPFADPETGEPGTRRVYFLAARRVDSTRYWPDFVHRHTCRWREDAEALRAKVAAAWGELPGAHRFERNPHWAPDNRPDPLSELAPFGVEWAREQAERAGP